MIMTAGMHLTQAPLKGACPGCHQP